jgi:hypothetical protein
LALNEAIGGRGSSQVEWWRLKMEPRRVCKAVDADSLHFDEGQHLAPDPQPPSLRNVVLNLVLESGFGISTRFCFTVCFFDDKKRASNAVLVQVQ